MVMAVIEADKHSGEMIRKTYHIKTADQKVQLSKKAQRALPSQPAQTATPDMPTQPALSSQPAQSTQPASHTWKAYMGAMGDDSGLPVPFPDELPVHDAEADMNMFQPQDEEPTLM